MNYLLHHYLTASNLYHLAAFVLTGAASVYTVQLIKIVKGNSLGKRVLQLLNLVFNTLYTAAGAIIAGGAALGATSKTALALTAFSAGFYRFHDSYLFKKFEADIAPEVTFVSTAPTQPVPEVSTNQFVQ